MSTTTQEDMNAGQSMAGQEDHDFEKLKAQAEAIRAKIEEVKQEGREAEDKKCKKRDAIRGELRDLEQARVSTIPWRRAWTNHIQETAPEEYEKLVEEFNAVPKNIKGEFWRQKQDALKEFAAGPGKEAAAERLEWEAKVARLNNEDHEAFDEWRAEQHDRKERREALEDRLGVVTWPIEEKAREEAARLLKEERICVAQDELIQSAGPALNSFEPGHAGVDYEAAEKLAGIGMKSLLAVGPSGSGKTRATLAAAMKLLKFHPWSGVLWITGFDFADTVTACGDSTTRKDAKEKLREMAEVDLLIMDEVGHDKFTEARRSKFFALMDRRTSRGLPTWMTTNHGQERLSALIGGTGEENHRIMRRVMQNTEVVVFT